MTRPPSTIHLECNVVQQDGTLAVCPDTFESNGWTLAWEHQNVTHAQEQIRWTLAGD